MPSILLIHGVSSSRNTWWRLADDLAELGWQVHAVDLLGHGGRRNPAPWTVADLARDVIEQAGTDHVDLIVGHSLGAVVALTLCALEPGFAHGVLLEDPPGLGGSDASRVADSVEAGAERALADPAAERISTLAQNPLWAATDANNAIANRRSLDVDSVSAFLRSGGWDLPRLVAGCPIPVQLLVAAGPATALPDPDRSAVLAALPAGRVREIVSGHGIHRDRPALWLDTVSRFAAELAVTPA